MSKLRIFLMLMGGLLAGLGLIVSLVTALSIAADVPATVSPFDQTDDMIAPQSGIAPTLLPTLQSKGGDSPEQGKAPLPEADKGLTLKIPPLTETPPPVSIPDRIVIPAIALDAPVVPAVLRTIAYLGKHYPQWKAPNFFAAGWAATSALPGTIDNTVLFGHHNTAGEVFAHLVDLQVNDLIVVYAGERKFTYIVVLKMILPERNQSVGIRLQNAQWILPSEDERLTLLTCWPAASNSHRLIIVALPILVDNLKTYLPVPRITPGIR